MLNCDVHMYVIVELLRRTNWPEVSLDPNLHGIINNCDYE